MTKRGIGLAGEERETGEGWMQSRAVAANQMNSSRDGRCVCHRLLFNCSMDSIKLKDGKEGYPQSKRGGQNGTHIQLNSQAPFRLFSLSFSLYLSFRLYLLLSPPLSHIRFTPFILSSVICIHSFFSLLSLSHSFSHSLTLYIQSLHSLFAVIIYFSTSLYFSPLSLPVTLLYPVTH